MHEMSHTDLSLYIGSRLWVELGKGILRFILTKKKYSPGGTIEAPCCYRCRATFNNNQSCTYNIAMRWPSAFPVLLFYTCTMSTGLRRNHETHGRQKCSGSLRKTQMKTGDYLNPEWRANGETYVCVDAVDVLNVCVYFVHCKFREYSAEDTT